MDCEKIKAEKDISVYRYQFTKEINDAITDFAKIHMFDHRHDYKEGWNSWWESNKDILEAEINRLQGLGYKGNVKDKMYKAGRYYFRKKVDKLFKTCFRLTNIDRC